jgi:hypothetical protein
MKIFALVLFMAILGCTAVLCLLFPRKAQAAALKAASRPAFLRSALVCNYIKSPQYSWLLLSTGIVSLLALAFISWLIIKCWLEGTPIVD